MAIDEKISKLICIFCIQGGYNFYLFHFIYFFGYNWIQMTPAFLMADYAVLLVACTTLHKCISLWWFTIFCAYIAEQNSTVINM